jgi:acyl-coenzyme A thioesterase PaaI-like protein
MWQASTISRAGTLHVLRLVCAVAVTSSHHGSNAFQPLPQRQHPSDTATSRLVTRCDSARPAVSPYPSHKPNQISVLRDSPLSLSEPNKEPSCEDLLLSEEQYEQMTMPTRGQLDGHAIFGTLHGETMIEKYRIWKRKGRRDESDALNDDDNNSSSDIDVVIGLVTFGSHLNGHPQLVHGGILSLIFDDICGFAYEAVGVPHAVTANLNVDYRAPVPAGSQVRLSVQLEHREGRKLFWKAQMTSMDQQVLYAEATSLYIIPRSAAAQ